MSLTLLRPPTVHHLGVSPRTIRRFAESAAVADGSATSLARFDTWFAERVAANQFRVARVPLGHLDGWSSDPATGDLMHRSGRFFTVAGLDVRTDRAGQSAWRQPIIVQPEVGILGILVKEFDGVLHCLMQAKMEPGNVGLVQLSPTVQATRSNYMGVHRGSGIRYLDYFLGAEDSTVHVDVQQSEQGSWFLHKRNRNMIVETTADVPEHPDFCWLTLGQLWRLLARDNVLNMDSRTVLSCLPFSGDPSERPGDDFGASLDRSLSGVDGALHDMNHVVSWISAVRSTRELIQRRIPLRDTVSDGWHLDPDRIRHRDGKYFEIVGVDVSASNREVASWTQPLLAPAARGLAAFVVKRIAGVLHVLVRAHVEAGTANVAELGPTVKCAPANYAGVPREHRPPYLEYVLGADPGRIRYDVVLSEEGGRFLAAECRYVVVEAEDDFPLETPADCRWLSMHQLVALLRHCNYLNVEARTLVACLQSLR